MTGVQTCALPICHNWSISLEFSSEKLDQNGFVVDFGKLKYIKRWIDENLDHACILNENDPCLSEFRHSKYFKLFVIPDCSCEGLSMFLFKTLNDLIREKEGGRVKIIKLTVTEDSKNSTTFSE